MSESKDLGRSDRRAAAPLGDPSRVPEPVREPALGDFFLPECGQCARVWSGRCYLCQERDRQDAALAGSHTASPARMKEPQAPSEQ